MEGENKLDIKIVVDKKRNRVLYAEGDQDFVDVLFSFLILPLGAIVKLLDKKSGLGCIDHLYGIIENMDAQYFKTKACKTMLLSPLSSMDPICHYMKLQYNENWREWKAYVCPSCNDNKSELLFSLVPNSICSCGLTMEYDSTKVSLPIRDKGKDGIFVKEGLYLVAGDLSVMPASKDSTRKLLDKFEISGYVDLEKINVKFGIDEVKELLRSSLTSRTPLDDAFNDKIPKDHSFFKCLEEKINNFLRGEVVQMKYEPTTMVLDGKFRLGRCSEGVNVKKLTINLFTNRATDEPIYVIAGGDFVDLLFSFLNFPLASIRDLLIVSWTRFGDVLRGAVELSNSILFLKSLYNCIKSESNISAILDAKLASYHGTDNQLLDIKESDDFLFPREIEHVSPLDQQVHKFDMRCINPKFDQPRSQLGGKYMREEKEYLITENMEVLPLSTISILDVLKKLKINMKDLEEQKFDITKFEAVEILRSCLLHKNSLNVALQNLLQEKIRETSFTTSSASSASNPF